MAIDWDYERSRCWVPKPKKTTMEPTCPMCGAPMEECRALLEGWISRPYKPALILTPTLMDELEKEIDNMPHSGLAAKSEEDNGNR